jgi:hypothetical protein
MSDRLKEKVGTISIAELLDSSLAKIAKTLYNKDDVTEKELMAVFEYDLEMCPKQLTVSAAETRQVRQYESNNYHLSMQLDIGGCHDAIIHQVETAPLGEKVSTYLEAKKLLYTMMREKYSRNENYLRDMIRVQKTEDGIKN